VPATNHLLRIELSTLDLQAPARAYLSARVVAGSELPLHELLSKAIVERNTAFGAQWIVSERLVLMLAAPAGFLLGIAVRNRLTGRTSWRIAQCAGAASLILGAIAGRYFWPLLSPIVPWAVAVRLERLGVVSWLGLALVCIAVVVLGRSSNSEPGSGAPGARAWALVRDCSADSGRTLNSGRTRDFGRTLDPGRTPDPGRRTPD
jgi:hypothetical protein